MVSLDGVDALRFTRLERLGHGLLQNSPEGLLLLGVQFLLLLRVALAAARKGNI
jgi:hypothetical protein